MGLKKYIAGSVLLLLGVFTYAFLLESGDYRIELFGTVFIFPVAAWIVLPTLVLFVATILHMIFYGLKSYFTQKSVTKDTDTLLLLIEKKLLKEDSQKSFQNRNFKELGEILEQLEINITNRNFSCHNKQINTAIDQILSIKSGKYISTKELKLDNHNPIMIENFLNRIDQDGEFALQVVEKPSSYPLELLKPAFLKVIEDKSITTIKKLLENIALDEEMAIALFKKDSEQESQFAMNNEQILSIMKKLNLTNTQLIQIAQNYKTHLSPDQIIALFENLTVENEEYTPAYLYILAEYEMIDKMRDIVENSSPNEFLPFKALIDLKDAGKNSYSLETLSYK